MESTYQKYKDQGFLAIYLIAEDAESNATDTDDAAVWADTYGLTFPVLADAGWTVGNRFEVDFGIASYSLLGPGLEVLIKDGNVSDADIEAALETVQ